MYIGNIGKRIKNECKFLGLIHAKADNFDANISSQMWSKVYSLACIIRHNAEKLKQ